MSLYLFIERKKERKKEKKIYLPMARYRTKLEHTIGLTEHDEFRKKLNISYKGKVHVKAENPKELIMRKFSMPHVES